jgi:hypothetical protein
VGDYGQVDLAPEERRGVVRRRLHAAAARRGLALRFRPGPRAALIFRVTAPSEPARQMPLQLVQQTLVPRGVPPSEPVGRTVRRRHQFVKGKQWSVIPLSALHNGHRCWIIKLRHSIVNGSAEAREHTRSFCLGDLMVFGRLYVEMLALAGSRLQNFECLATVLSQYYPNGMDHQGQHQAPVYSVQRVSLDLQG